MVPLWGFVPSPLGVIKIRDRPWLDVVSFGCRVFESLGVEVNSFVDAVLYVVSLPRNWVRQYFVRLDDFLEFVLGCGSVLIRSSDQEVRMALFSQLVVGYFDLFGSGC